MWSGGRLQCTRRRCCYLCECLVVCAVCVHRPAMLRLRFVSAPVLLLFAFLPLLSGFIQRGSIPFLCDRTDPRAPVLPLTTHHLRGLFEHDAKQLIDSAR